MIYQQIEQLVMAAYKLRISGREEKAKQSVEDLGRNKQKLADKNKQLQEIGKKLVNIIEDEKISSWADRIMTVGALVVGGVAALASGNFGALQGALGLGRASTSGTNAFLNKEVTIYEGIS